jgi:hypothetical protein
VQLAAFVLFEEYAEFSKPDCISNYDQRAIREFPLRGAYSNRSSEYFLSTRDDLFPFRVSPTIPANDKILSCFLPIAAAL